MTPGSQKHLMVGTAGHVDHGKTALIKAMTGINTDRLKEEQERGLTIDLGFASLKLPSGREVGIVDGPGHESFLKNMLAGASGVDIALLVVAADEGVMPQTREHLEILELLETAQGVVALTKCDVAEEEWIDVVEEDLRENLHDTFIDSANIVRAACVTAEGVQDLIEEIDRLAETTDARSVEGPFRLPIDRVFTMTGFGTVVTGTLVSGTLKVGDPVRILPQGLESRVRQLQVHGKKQDEVLAGNRTAVNLVGVDVSDLERGNVLLPPGYLQPTSLVDASVSVVADSPRPLKNRTRIRLHVGTAEVIGRASVLGAEQIAPGCRGFVQLALEGPIVAARGDRFVLRFYSPMRVLGGGVILDPSPRRHRRSDKAAVERLERKLAGDPADMVQDALSLHETGLVKQELARMTGLTERDVEAALAELVDDGRVLQLSGRYLDKSALESLATRAEGALESYHKTHPMRPGMPKEELRARLGSKIDQKGFQALVAAMSSDERAVVSEAAVRLPGHRPTLSEAQQQLMERIEDEYRTAGVNPPLASEVESKHGAQSREITALLADGGSLVKVTPELSFHREAIERAEKALRSYLEANSEIAVSQFRDVIGSSRKYVVPLLEYFDARRVTRRAGDLRTLFG